MAPAEISSSRRGASQSAIYIFFSPYKTRLVHVCPSQDRLKASWRVFRCRIRVRR